MAASDSFRFPALKAVTPTYFVKKVFLEISQNSQENTCAKVSILIKLRARFCNFIKIETLAQVFSCEILEFSKSTFSYRLPPVAASAAITLLKKRFPQKCFSVNFEKFVRTSFDRALPDDCFLSLSVNFEKFFRTSLL